MKANQGKENEQRWKVRRACFGPMQTKRVRSLEPDGFYVDLPFSARVWAYDFR